jgi:hypothetical protein
MQLLLAGPVVEVEAARGLQETRVVGVTESCQAGLAGVGQGSARGWEVVRGVEVAGLGVVMGRGWEGVEEVVRGWEGVEAGAWVCQVGRAVVEEDWEGGWEVVVRVVVERVVGDWVGGWMGGWVEVGEVVG